MAEATPLRIRPMDDVERMEAPEAKRQRVRADGWGVEPSSHGQLSQEEAGSMCRVVGTSLPSQMTQEEAEALFGAVGAVTQVQLHREGVSADDPYAVVTYANAEDALAALALLHGQLVQACMLSVQRPCSVPFQAAEEAARTWQGASVTLRQQVMAAVRRLNGQEEEEEEETVVEEGGASSGPSARVFVGNVPVDIGSMDLQRVFEPFGTIHTCTLVGERKDAQGNVVGPHQGHGTLVFESHDSAALAVSAMDGFDFNGTTLQVRIVPEQQSQTNNTQQQMQQQQLAGAGSATQQGNSLQNAAMVAAQLNAQLGAGVGAGGIHGRGAGGGGGGMGQQQQQQQQHTLSSEENLTIRGSSQRMAIMQKLARGDPDLRASRCVLLANMVTPEGVDDSLEKEIVDECSRFGFVEDVVIYEEEVSSQNSQVKIFVLFKDSGAATQCLQTMHGRWFDGRQIHAVLYPEERFREGKYSG